MANRQTSRVHVSQPCLLGQRTDHHQKRIEMTQTTLLQFDKAIVTWQMRKFSEVKLQIACVEEFEILL